MLVLWSKPRAEAEEHCASGALESFQLLEARVFRCGGSGEPR
jgi:hypothetical protein